MKFENKNRFFMFGGNRTKKLTVRVFYLIAIYLQKYGNTFYRRYSHACNSKNKFNYLCYMCIPYFFNYVV